MNDNKYVHHFTIINNIWNREVKQKTRAAETKSVFKEFISRSIVQGPT